MPDATNIFAVEIYETVQPQLETLARTIAPLVRRRPGEPAEPVLVETARVVLAMVVRVVSRDPLVVRLLTLSPAPTWLELSARLAAGVTALNEFRKNFFVYDEDEDALVWKFG